MSIGEKIIAAINEKELAWGLEGETPFWNDGAAEKLEAVVEAHIEERVRIRMALDRQAERERTAKLEAALMIAARELWNEFGGSEENGPQMYFDDLLVRASKPSTDYPAD